MTTSKAEIDARAAAAVHRIEREAVAWIRWYTFGRRDERPEDAWREHEAEWVLFSAGRFFQIKVARGLVVERSRPTTRQSVYWDVCSWLAYEENDRPAQIARHQAFRAERRAQMGEEAFAQFELDLAFGNEEIAERYVRKGLAIPQNRAQPDFTLIGVPESLREEIRRKTDTRGFPKLLATCAITLIGQAASDMPIATNTFGPIDPVKDPDGWAAQSKALMELLAVVEDFRRITFREVTDPSAP